MEVGFLEEFLFTDAASGKSLPLNARSRFQTTSLDEWLLHWSRLIYGRKSINDMPLWLQYFAKIIFQVINKSGEYVVYLIYQNVFKFIPKNENIFILLTKKLISQEKSFLYWANACLCMGTSIFFKFIEFKISLLLIGIYIILNIK